MDVLEQEEFTSPHDVYKRLLDVISNENCSPQLLPFQESIVECIVDQIQHMKDTIEKLGPKLDSYCKEQHSLELERFCFVVNQYYRTRIKKIEQNAEFLVALVTNNRQKATQILSHCEIKYLDNYAASIDCYLKQVLLQNMPANTRSLRSAAAKTNASNDDKQLENKYVFVKARNPVSLLIDEPSTGEQLLEMQTDSQHFLPFTAVQPQLHSASKDLLIL